MRGETLADARSLLELVGEAYAFADLVLCREHEDFGERDVRLLALARPHLMQAYRNAELWGARAAMLVALEEGLDILGRHLVVLDPKGRVEFATRCFCSQAAPEN